MGYSVLEGDERAQRHRLATQLPSCERHTALHFSPCFLIDPGPEKTKEFNLAVDRVSFFEFFLRKSLISSKNHGFRYKIAFIFTKTSSNLKNSCNIKRGSTRRNEQAIEIWWPNRKKNVFSKLQLQRRILTAKTGFSRILIMIFVISAKN